MHTTACVAALVTALAATPCRAQDTGAAPAMSFDSMAASPIDSVRRDSTRRDSAAVAPGDTLPRAGRDSAGPPTRPPRPSAPVDSALGTACEGSAGGPPDLLIVTFRPTTTASERAAVAQEVGGALVGPSEHAAPGAWYLRVPGSAGDRSVADRLIRFSAVLEVGATRCPW